MMLVGQTISVGYILSLPFSSTFVSFSGDILRYLPPAGALYILPARPAAFYFPHLPTCHELFERDVTAAVAGAPFLYCCCTVNDIAFYVIMEGEKGQKKGCALHAA